MNPWGRIRTATVVAMVGAGAVLSGCGDDDADLGAAADQVVAATDLTGALSVTPATDATMAYVEYGNVAAVREHTGGEIQTAGGRLNGWGYSTLFGAGPTLAEQTGFDPGQAAAVGLVAGEPPDQVGVLVGSFDVDEIASRLEEAGGERRDAPDGAYWVWGENGEFDPANMPFTGVVTQLNNIYVSEHTIVHGITLDAVRAVVERSGDTLADSAPHQALADCLGDDVSAALLLPTVDGSGYYASGSRIGGDGAVTELLCVPGDEAAAAQIVETLRTGESMRAGRPWHELVVEPAAEVVDGGLVRVTARPASPDSPGALFLDATRAGDLDGFLPS